LPTVSTGICGRAFGTPCIHEHSCLRCSMHWPDPAQQPRIAEIRDNLTARIAEAKFSGSSQPEADSTTGSQQLSGYVDRAY
jgi:hypothetical protein